MNRNLDGTEISTEQLVKIAVDHELRTEQELSAARSTIHNHNLYRSMLLSLTAKTRLSLFNKGELKLQ